MCGGIFTVLEELDVENIIISKQYESSENYRKFIELIKDKKIKINIIEDEKKLKIEKNLYIHFLWPSSGNIIKENILNNNSLVFKLNYKKFSMLFTGDIEKIAENEILKKYQNNINILRSTILKVPHHGSKSSSTNKFVDAVKPKMVLIGVGKNNKFGHPNIDVLKRYEEIGAKIYRTDINKEIKLIINNCIKITTQGNNITEGL